MFMGLTVQFLQCLMRRLLRDRQKINFYAISQGKGSLHGGALTLAFDAEIRPEFT
jgi:hypothetical protein